MKKLIPLLVLIVIIAGVFLYVKDSKQKKIDADYEKIATVETVAKKMVNSKYITEINKAQWTIFDVRAVYQNDNKFYQAIKAELGDDFDSQLSNGDYLFIGFYPLDKKVKVFAGDPQRPNTMIYPTWEYDKLEQR